VIRVYSNFPPVKSDRSSQSVENRRAVGGRLAVPAFPLVPTAILS